MSCLYMRQSKDNDELNALTSLFISFENLPAHNAIVNTSYNDPSLAFAIILIGKPYKLMKPAESAWL